MNLESASLERHMGVRTEFPPIGEFIRLLFIDVYGRPMTGLEGLREKAEMLGSGRVRVDDLHAGFARLPRAEISSCTAAQEDKRRRLGYSVIFNSAAIYMLDGPVIQGCREWDVFHQRPQIPIRRPC